MTNIKTIDINAKEWFDRANGNSYFSGEVILNYAMKDCKVYKMPFQYGYGDHYIDMANQLLMKENVIPQERYDNGAYKPLWQYCKKNKVILRMNKQRGCLKKEL